MYSQLDQELLRKARNIRLLGLDVDGVLTDGRLCINDKGEESKCFHVRDGHGIKTLISAGIPVALISARQSAAVACRVRELGIPHYLSARSDKATALQELMKTCGVRADEVCYVGDDLLDLPILRQAGLAITVADGHFSLKACCHWQTHNRGGQGAVREVCDLLLYAHDLLAAIVIEHLIPQQNPESV
ncbi:MAG TPA: HAD-IIIA family hydrolase [Gammaproteobacteria bacterium]|nr:HAD-IIIA family hydrolase [Gammaproteobacteria bacterium]